MSPSVLCPPTSPPCTSGARGLKAKAFSFFSCYFFLKEGIFYSNFMKKKTGTNQKKKKKAFINPTCFLCFQETISALKSKEGFLRTEE